MVSKIGDVVVRMLKMTFIRKVSKKHVGVYTVFCRLVSTCKRVCSPAFHLGGIESHVTHLQAVAFLV